MNNKQISNDPKNQINEPGVQRDIHKRIYEFVVTVIKITRLLQRNPENQVFINQILRSATSVGANDQEADAAESRKDFIAKYSIVKKELKETGYWLRLIEECNQSINNDIKLIRNESEELLHIVSKIIINTKNKS